MSAENNSSTLEKLVPVLLVVSVGLAFAVGALWQKVTGLEGGSSSVAGTDVAVAPNDPNAVVDPYTELTDSQKDSFEEVTETDHIRGSFSAADVYLVEYSDFECPFCQSFHPTLQQALDEYGDQVAWVYRHYPLTFIHPNAEPAAQASECVAELGGNDAFWDYSDKLFEGSPASLNADSLSSLAGEVGVDTAAFDSCLESDKYAEKVQSQLDSGSAVGVTGTPGTVVVNKNGDAWLVPGAVQYATLQEAIETSIAAL